MRIAFKTAQALMVGIKPEDHTEEEWKVFNSDEFQPDYFIIEAESEEELRVRVNTMLDKLFNAAFGRASVE